VGRPSAYIVGLDLGQAADYTAVAVVEHLPQAGPPVYHVRHLDRVRQVPYPVIVDRVAAILRAPELADYARLVVDATGVGAPIVDLFVRAGLAPVAIHIHGGDTVTRDGGSRYHVPKRDLIMELRALFDTARLRIAAALPLASALAEELRTVRMRIDPRTGHDSYAAWRETEHDDLTLSVALAAWYGEHCPLSAADLVAFL